MSRQKVTIEAVRLAIQALHDAGKTPSINQILAITGGSKSTVAAMMREINAETNDARENTPLPGNVLSAMERFTTEIWQIADVAAKAQFEEETRRYLTSVHRYEDEIAELAEIADRAEEARDAALCANEQLEVRIRQLEAERSQLSSSLAEYLARLEDAREQMAVVETINEELKAELHLAQQEAEFAGREAKLQADLLATFTEKFDRQGVLGLCNMSHGANTTNAEG